MKHVLYVLHMCRLRDLPSQTRLILTYDEDIETVEGVANYTE